jgi:hypothetical protein
VEDRGLPAQGVPAELLDHRGKIADGQVGYQLPVDGGAVRGRIDLLRMDLREVARFV